MVSRLAIAKRYLRARFRRPFRSREELLTWQDQEVGRFLQTVLPKSPFYRDHFGQRPLTDWRHLPPINKKIMMTHFDRLNTVGIKKEEAAAVAINSEKSRDFTPTINQFTVGLSSGTSGYQGLFLLNPAEQEKWVGELLAKLSYSVLKKQRIAFFLRANNNLFSSVGSRWLQFRYFDLLYPVRQHIEQLNQLQPTILVGPPTLLRFLASAQIDNQLNIKPTQIISVADVLDPHDQKMIQTTFTQKVDQIYQATEGFLATTCAWGTFHFHEDLLVIQKRYLDEAKTKFMPIITDFNRFTQPIIRYQLDDIITERTTPCPCGSLMLAATQIEGRSDDIFYLQSKKSAALIPIFPDFIRRAIITSNTDIEAYRAEQIEPDQLIISLTTDSQTIQNEVVTSLTALWSQLECIPPKLQFDQFDPPLPGMKKEKRIQRTCQIPNLGALK